MNYHRLKIVVFALLFGGTVFAASAENLLLAHTLPNGLPDGRRAPEGATVAVRDGKLNVDFTKPGSLQYSVYITPDHRRLLLSGELAAKISYPVRRGGRTGVLPCVFSTAPGNRPAPGLPFSRFRETARRSAAASTTFRRGGPAAG